MMDAKTLLEMMQPNASWILPQEALTDDAWKIIRSALRLAAALEGPEEETPIADSIVANVGELDVATCDQICQLEQRMYRALRALRECEERAGEIEAERDSFKGYAESMHGWMDRVLSCVERAEQDIGGETMSAIIPDGGDIYESFSEYRSALAAKGDGNDL